jgi:oligopeptide/dipeptide ABC transporter ATP-binding protein
MTKSLLALSDLHVTFSTRRGLVEAVRGVTLSLGEGEMLGLVGESGSGKSVTGFAITRLLDAAGRITAGHIRFRGQDITRISAGDFRHLHGAAMAMIFQNPRAALNPIRAVGDQIADAITAHKRMPRDEARAQALGLLRAVQIRDPEKRMAAYPHELSGGMCQRVMIAMAISCNPALLIADEPTTALDVTIQAQILDLLASLQKKLGMAVILITHDLGVVAQVADHVAVMYAGRVVEAAPVVEIFERPQHPYTVGLLHSIPRMNAGGERLRVIPGSVPDPVHFPGGCPFHPRCPIADQGCAAALPDLTPAGAGHVVRCFKAGQLPL